MGVDVLQHVERQVATHATSGLDTSIEFGPKPLKKLCTETIFGNMAAPNRLDERRPLWRLFARAPI